MSLIARAWPALRYFPIMTLFIAGVPVAAQEEGQVPGAIPDPSTYQGSMEQQRQSDAQDQQFRQQMDQQQQNQQPQYEQQPQGVQNYAPAPSQAPASTSLTSREPHSADVGPDSPTKAIARGDFSTALRLARPKAIAGDASAQHALGYLYETGSGVPQDFTTAASWNRKAAEQGNAGGQADIGWMYYKGLGVPQDPVQAYKWLVLAGRENMTARRHLQEVAAAITYDQMSEGLSLAQQWTPTVQHKSAGPGEHQ